MNLIEHIGNTPLIRLHTLSEITGCEIFAKAEFMNPGGSVKDRAAKFILQEALSKGLIKIAKNKSEASSCVFEGTAGNTGIGLSMLANSLGIKSVVVMPDNQAAEKYQTLEAYGAEIVKVTPVPFANPNHFYHTAKKLSEERQGFWANQFENLSNMRAHYEGTGPEIWKQTEGKVQHFVAASGTGGTIAGVSKFLKEKNSKVKVTLVDPDGSGLYSYLKTGEIKAEGSSITEGIGIMRLTANFKEAIIDDVVRVNDQQMLAMLHYLAKNEGLLVGTSAALNVFAAFELAKSRKNSKEVIVTVLCDSALRYQSRVFNADWLASKNLKIEGLTL